MFFVDVEQFDNFCDFIGCSPFLNHLKRRKEYFNKAKDESKMLLDREMT